MLFSPKDRMGPWNYKNNYVENGMNIWTEFFVILYVNCCTITIIITVIITLLSCVAFLRKWCHFRQFPPRLGTRKLNGGHKFLEIKIQKTWSYVRNRLKFAKISTVGKTCCVGKCKKMQRKWRIKNLIIVALWALCFRLTIQILPTVFGKFYST